jgi:hypothetical protein
VSGDFSIDLALISDFKTRSGTSNVSGALAVRYLGGILDLPGFWLEVGDVNSDVVKKLCSEMVRTLKDIGVDLLILGPICESEPPFDYDGLDFLATAVLVGLSIWFARLDEEDWAMQPWYHGFLQVLRILRGQVPCIIMSL